MNGPSTIQHRAASKHMPAEVANTLAEDFDLEGWDLPQCYKRLRQLTGELIKVGREQRGMAESVGDAEANYKKVHSLALLQCRVDHGDWNVGDRQAFAEVEANDALLTRDSLRFSFRATRDYMEALQAVIWVVKDRKDYLEAIDRA